MFVAVVINATESGRHLLERRDILSRLMAIDERPDPLIADADNEDILY